MVILLSCAKTMAESSRVKAPAGTEPLFAAQAKELALHMSQFSVEELKRLLQVNGKIALQNYRRFQEFHDADGPALQALLAYTGIVFKRIRPQDFTTGDFLYAQEHLRLTSFCYGLLRPLDRIRNYRMEGAIRLPELGSGNVFDYWRPLLTGPLIGAVRQQGGVLVNLASAEMKQLFDWKRVEREVTVITPEFQVEKEGKPATVVIYTKMCRGEMTRYILKNRLTRPEALTGFSFDGFTFRPELSDGATFRFTLRA